MIVGPFYPIEKPTDSDADLMMVAGRTGRAVGQIIEGSGRVIDLAGRPVPNARLEIWQANAAATRSPATTIPRRSIPISRAVRGSAPTWTANIGSSRSSPVPIPVDAGALRKPHIHFDLSGCVDRLVAQMYFPEPLNAADALLSMNIRAAMVIAAAADVTASGIPRYRWDMIVRSG